MGSVLRKGSEDWKKIMLECWDAGIGKTGRNAGMPVSQLQVSGLPHETGAPSEEFHRGLSPHPARRTPIIALIAGAMQQGQDQCFVAGMDDCTAKPVNSNELVRVLKNWLLEDRGQRGEILCMVLASL